MRAFYCCVLFKTKHRYYNREGWKLRGSKNWAEHHRVKIMLPSHYKECFLFAWFPMLLLAHSDTILFPVLVLNLVLLSGRSQDNFFSPTVLKFHCDCPSVVFFFFHSLHEPLNLETCIFHFWEHFLL